MTATIQQIEVVVSVLTPEEKQLLKDTITSGFWGDTYQVFLDKQGNIETVDCYGYRTNGASRAGNFKGHIVFSMFRSIYKKLCPKYRNQIGHVLSHCRDWWRDGRGSLLFIRREYCDAFEDWARS